MVNIAANIILDTEDRNNNFISKYFFTNLINI